MTLRGRLAAQPKTASSLPARPAIQYKGAPSLRALRAFPAAQATQMRHNAAAGNPG